MIDANERAFPVSASYSDDNPQVLIPTGGLTIRQHFAAIAMQGILASWGSESMPESKGIELMARTSIEAADALIKELNKTPQP